jgi:MarR family transcriptional regulator, organic hydroperoxide resistance regulator
MRSITDRDPDAGGGEAPYPTREGATEATVESILTEVGGWIGELRCASMARLVKGQVSMSHLHVLWLLQHQGAMPMNRLADLLGVSMSNATGIIDRMEGHGLVERVRVPDDRRLVLVQPAAAGVEALSQTESTRRDAMRAVIRRLSPTERPVVLEALRSLRRALSAEVESSAAHRHHFETAN